METTTATAVADPTAEEMTGEVVGIVFRNEETGFSILRLRVPGFRDPRTVAGVSMAAVGELVTATGEWTTHPTFGAQMKARTIVAQRPSSPQAIERYLASGVIRGIGPALATRIVQTFGADTFRVLDETPEQLGKVNGIGPRKLEELVGVWKEARAVREIQVFLAEYEIHGALAHRIMRQYGAAAIEVIENDPYRLAKEVRGIGFTTADAIARRLGIPETDPARIEAGLRHVATQASGSGHCGIPLAQFTKHACEALGLTAGWIQPVLDEQLRQRDFIVPVTMADDERFVFDRRLFDAEKRIAATLTSMVTAPPWAITRERAEEIASAAERTCGVTLAPGQRAAVVQALLARVSVLTGGPGTGKTSTLKVILEALRHVRADVKLAAPTGKAAKRMRETTGHEASTVARLIGMGSLDAGDTEIECDILIVDEASMVDVAMLDRLLVCLQEGAALMFVGDVDQLPSVGPGNCLGDLIASGAIPTVRLIEVFRQAQTSAIVRNAHRINRGEGLEAQGGEGGDFYFIPSDSPEQITDRIVALVHRYIPERVGIASSEVQVLSPMRRTPTGADNLNQLLQVALNPDPAAKVVRFGKRYGVGDRVLQTVNNYELGVMNGESGVVIGVDDEASIVRVQVDNDIVQYPFSDLDQLDLAYAMSVHKSQGSQFPAVVIPVTTQHYMMLQRAIVYTAITRATRFCVLVGQPRALDMAIRNTRAEPRITSLGLRLSAGAA